MSKIVWGSFAMGAAGLGGGAFWLNSVLAPYNDTLMDLVRNPEWIPGLPLNGMLALGILGLGLIGALAFGGLVLKRLWIWIRQWLSLVLPPWVWTPYASRVFKRAPTKVEDGWVYVMCNTPGILKIGTTQKHPDLRAKELDTTGVSEPFRVLYSLQCGYAHRVEGQVHRLLDSCRIRQDREFFKCSLKTAIRAIKAAEAQVRHQA